MSKTKSIVAGVVLGSIATWYLAPRPTQYLDPPPVYLDPCGRKEPHGYSFSHISLKNCMRDFETKPKNKDGLYCSEGYSALTGELDYYECYTRESYLWTVCMAFISGEGPGIYNDPQACVDETLETNTKDTK